MSKGVQKNSKNEFPSAFIAGEACHTHSPKAGQGMNVSIHDAFNLGWKLSSVLLKRTNHLILNTYNMERRAVAKNLIKLDKDFAKLVAKNISVPYSKTSLTKDPNYNVKLGTYYFNMLLEDYDGVFPFAIGAYNAGPNRIKAWLQRYGDPNRGQINFVDWVELIRFEETRNYVQRVLENYNVYRYILEQKPIKMKNFFKDDPLY